VGTDHQIGFFGFLGFLRVRVRVGVLYIEYLHKGVV
jgi:hypothetical protein